jgi:cytochrome c oxidase subunit 4
MNENKLLYLVYGILLLLLALSVGSTYLELGTGNTLLNMGIAVLQAVIIVWFFMRLRHARRSVRVVAAASVLWLLPLFCLTLVDYASR